MRKNTDNLHKRRNRGCKRVATIKPLHTVYRNSELNLPLTEICDAINLFNSFSVNTRRAAISLKAAELGVAQIHFYAIAAHLNAKVGGAA